MKNKKGLSEIVTTLLIIFLTLVAIGIIWVVVRNVIEGEHDGSSDSEYLGCLKNFANEYCESLNYSYAIFIGSTVDSGVSSHAYFSCNSERDYQGFGKFINTIEEKEYCKNEVKNEN